MPIYVNDHTTLISSNSFLIISDASIKLQLYSISQTGLFCRQVLCIQDIDFKSKQNEAFEGKLKKYSTKANAVIGLFERQK